MEKLDAYFVPSKNPEAISIIKESDGNYRGYIQKDGKVVTARQGDPQTVLELLLTHPGGEERISR